ncbi:aminotransferase class IV [Pontibacter sp. CAU 1760]
MENKVYAFIRGEFVLQQQAFLHVSDLAIQRGYGVFDFFKVKDNVPLFLDDYLARFYASAQAMHLPLPYTDVQIRDFIHQLIERNNIPLAGIKIILTGGYSETGFTIQNPNLLLLQQPLSLPGPALREKGLRIIAFEHTRELPWVKTINYSVGIRLQQQLRAAGADDVLYHQNGVISEFPRCNFFAVRQDGTLVTPAEHVLKGITRKNVLRLARQRYKVLEGPVTLEDLRDAQEAFLTSTTKQILPLVAIDGHRIGNGKPGPTTMDLWRQLEQLESGMQSG